MVNYHDPGVVILDDRGCAYAAILDHTNSVLFKSHALEGMALHGRYFSVCLSASAVTFIAGHITKGHFILQVGSSSLPSILSGMSFKGVFPRSERFGLVDDDRPLFLIPGFWEIQGLIVPFGRSTALRVWRPSRL